MRMLHENQIKKLLKLGSKMHPDFSYPPTLVDVSATNELPLVAFVSIITAEKARELHGKGRCRHRVMVNCPKCNKFLSMGRLNQHYPCK